jgi:hypothetical protein
MIKSRRMKLSGHVARIGESGNAYNLLWGKSDGKRLLGRTERWSEVIIKTDFMESRLK